MEGTPGLSLTDSLSLQTVTIRYGDTTIKRPKQDRLGRTNHGPVRLGLFTLSLYDYEVVTTW